MVATSHTRMERGKLRGPQISALVGGSALAIYGISRRSAWGAALAVGGCTIAVIGAKPRRSARAGSVWTSVLVNCSPQEAYRFWRDFENLPRFMNRLQSVSVLENGRSQWIAIGPKGRPIRWYAEISGDRENESIAWRSLPDSDVAVDAEVKFKQASAGRGTLISARIAYSALPGTSGALARFLNKGVNFFLRQDLRRLEAIMESGEIPTTEGQPHGPRDLITGVLRVADPTRPVYPGSSLKDAFTARRRIA